MIEATKIQVTKTLATKKFGLWTLTFLVIANMVGAGVFTTSGFTLKALGTPSLVVTAWIVGGLIAIAGAVGYGQLARAMPESGGEYLFLSRAAHPLLGFIAGWVSLIAGFSGAIAFAATAFEDYLLPARDDLAWLPADSVAIAVIVGAGIFHGVRARVGAAVQNSVVVLKLGLLAAILIFAATKISTHTWHHETLAGVEMGGWTLVSAFAGSLVWISLSYLGFNAAVYIADEVDEAGKIVPRALLIGTSTVLVLYVLLNMVFVFAPAAEDIAGVPDVAAVAAAALGGNGFASFVRLTICAALLTSVFSMMMAAPRVYAKMADDGLMPGFMRIKGETPQAAIAVQILVASALVLISSLRGLLSYLGLTLSLSAACAVACLFSPRVRTRPVLHPSHILPALYIGGTLTAATLMTVSEPRQLLGTLATVVAGVLAYSFIRGANPIGFRVSEPDSEPNRLS